MTRQYTSANSPSRSTRKPAWGYGPDLAYVHHTGFGVFAARSAPGIRRLLRHPGIVQGHIVDIGCGSGILAARLTAWGYRVTGIDSSPSMIRLARTVAPRAVFRRGSFLDGPLPACDAVVSTGECINYLFDP